MQNLIIVCGGRDEIVARTDKGYNRSTAADVKRWAARSQTIRHVLGSYPIGSTLITGYQRGVDQEADRLGRRIGLITVRVPYAAYANRRGGYLRNTVIAELGEHAQDAGVNVVVHAFPGGVGTALMTDIALTHGLTVKEHSWSA